MNQMIEEAEEFYTRLVAISPMCVALLATQKEKSDHQESNQSEEN